MRHARQHMHFWHMLLLLLYKHSENPDACCQHPRKLQRPQSPPSPFCTLIKDHDFHCTQGSVITTLGLVISIPGHPQTVKGLYIPFLFPHSTFIKHDFCLAPKSLLSAPEDLSEHETLNKGSSFPFLPLPLHAPDIMTCLKHPRIFEHCMSLS